MMLMAIFIFLFIKLIRIIVKLSIISNDEGFNIFLILYREIITIRAAEVCAVKLMVTVLLLVNNYVGLILQA